MRNTVRIAMLYSNILELCPPGGGDRPHPIRGPLCLSWHSDATDDHAPKAPDNKLSETFRANHNQASQDPYNPFALRKTPTNLREKNAFRGTGADHYLACWLGGSSWQH
jgi:hypothetical protein